MNRIFTEPPTVPFWRYKNDKDILVHSKHNLQFYDQTDGYRNCEYNKCALFKHLIKESVFTDNDEKNI
jgi:hypothetical protein